MKIALTVPEYGTVDPGTVPTASGQKVVWVFVDIILIIAILLTAYFILKGAWDLITSEGKKEKIFNAQKTIMYAIFGLFVIAISFLLMSAFGSFVGTNLLKIPF
jgi:hypothetical protein